MWIDTSLKNKIYRWQVSPWNDAQCHLSFSSVQLFSRVRLLVTPWIAAHQASLSITNSWSLLKLMSIKLVMPSSHLILCRPLLLLPPIPPSTRVFSNESTLRIRWYWSFSFNISPSNEYPPRLISFRMDWLDLLAVQRKCKLKPEWNTITYLLEWLKNIDITKCYYGYKGTRTLRHYWWECEMA